MKVLWASRYSLVIAIAGWVLALVLGVVGVVPAEVAMLAGVLFGLGIGLAALLCVIAQVVVLVSSKRRVSNG